MAKSDIFVNLSNIDENNIGRVITIEELEDNGLHFGNGGSWCRSSSKLAKTYNIVRVRGNTGNRILSLQIVGLNEIEQQSQYIRKDLRDIVTQQPCCNCSKTEVEVDHKNGFKNDLRMNDSKLQTLDDFQPLCKSCNDVKRQRCKDCKSTGKRFDAKIIGFPVSFYSGDDNHTEDVDGCIGCYFYSPLDFKKEIYAIR